MAGSGRTHHDHRGRCLPAVLFDARFDHGQRRGPAREVLEELPVTERRDVQIVNRALGESAGDRLWRTSPSACRRRRHAAAHARALGRLRSARRLRCLANRDPWSASPRRCSVLGWPRPVHRRTLLCRPGSGNLQRNGKRSTPPGTRADGFCLRR